MLSMLHLQSGTVINSEHCVRRNPTGSVDDNILGRSLACYGCELIPP